MTLLRAAIWAALLLLASRFVLLPVRVSGISMLPTYRNHTVNFINRLAYIDHPPRRGDVVAIRFSPQTFNGFNPPHAMLLKRIVALPGETIAFVNGRILINGKILDEPYERRLECDWNIPPETLSTDEYYVVGDNRTMPAKDHTKGRCKRGQIIGKAVL